MRKGPATTRWLGHGEDPLFVLLLAIVNRARLDAYGKSKAVKPTERHEAIAFLEELKGVRANGDC